MASFGENNLGTASEIAKNKYQSDPNTVDAELYGDLSKIAGENPRGWRAGVAGFFKGAQHGSKLKASEKFNKTMDYLESINNSTIEKNQWYEKQKFAKAKVLPQVLSYMDNITKLDPLSRNAMVDDILEQFNEATGSDYKRKSIDGLNPRLITVGSKKGEKLLDLRNLFAGDEVLQKRMAMQTPEYLENMQQERADKERAFKIQEQNANSYAQGQNKNKTTNISHAGDSEETLTFGDQTYKVGNLNTIEKSARSDYQKQVYKDVAAIPKNNQVFDRNPNIGTSFINMLDNPDGIDSWFNIFARKLAGKDLTDMEILRKATNDLNLDTILGIPGKVATNLVKKAVQAASPSGKLTKGGFDVVSSGWVAKIHEANELSNAKYTAMQQGKSLVPTAYMGKKSQNEVQQNSPNDFASLGAVPR
jgi:hypothetical protein